jgi:hypothetical protein
MRDRRIRRRCRYVTVDERSLNAATIPYKVPDAHAFELRLASFVVDAGGRCRGIGTTTPGATRTPGGVLARFARADRFRSSEHFGPS